MTTNNIEGVDAFRSLHRMARGGKIRIDGKTLRLTSRDFSGDLYFEGEGDRVAVQVDATGTYLRMENLDGGAKCELLAITSRCFMTAPAGVGR